MSTTVDRRAGRGSSAPSTPVPTIYRVEGGAIAVATVVLFVLAGFSWWWLAALFLVFDLSFIGYAFGNRTGALADNLAHNYVAPAVLLTIDGILLAAGGPVPVLALVAGCWFFHVGLDRALGYGPRPSSADAAEAGRSGRR